MVLYLIQRSLIPFLLLLTFSAYSQNRPQWNDIPAGTYDIGFRVLQTYDYSRGYWPKKDFRGHEASRETARPLQIYIWYPAETGKGGSSMIFGDYIDLTAEELELKPATDEQKIEARDRLRKGPLNPYFAAGLDESAFQKILETPVPAVRNAPQAEGVYPLIIFPGGPMGQSVLMEYLASHGYVVVSFPLLGTHPAWYGRGEGTIEWYQSIADDIGFVYGKMKEFPQADLSQVAVIGMFAPSGILFQAQHMQLDAIASLDGLNMDAIKEAPGFNPNAIRIPVLDMPSVNNARRRTIVDSMVFSPRYLVKLENVQHREFYQFRRIAHPEDSHTDTTYKIIARYTKAFLDATLKGDRDAVQFLQSNPEDIGAPPNFIQLQKVDAAADVPTEDEFLLMIRNGRIAEAREIFEQVKLKVPHYKLCSENSLRSFAIFYRRDHGSEASVELFRLWTDMFPTSWRAENYLGETLYHAGQPGAAADAYGRAIELVRLDNSLDDEQKKSIIQQLKKRIRE